MEKIHVIALKEAIENKQKIDDYIKSRKAEFEETIKHEVSQSKALSALIDSIKAELTPEAIADFKESGNKKLSGGIGIRESKVVEYDSSVALTWAKEKDMFLTLDVKTFEKSAPSLGLDFVTVSTVQKVTFPKEIKLED